MKKQRAVKIILGLLVTNLYFGSSTLVLARWATPDDAAQEVTYEISHIYINKDGTSKCVSEREVKILKEQAKDLWAHYPIEYSTKIQNYKILDAKTIVNNQSYPVEPSQIQESPVASRYLGFDERNRVTISYPNLSLGASVFLKTESIQLQAYIPNHFFTILHFENNNYVKSKIIHIVSEIPLYIQQHNPEKLLEVVQSKKQDKNKTLYLVDIKQNRPFLKAIMDENNAIVNPKKIPMISICSMNTWPEFGKYFSIEYEKIKQESLPEVYQEIANIAKNKPTLIEKVNVITSMLFDKITYLMDGKTIQTGFIPQHLQAVADTRLGNCKDYSMATAVILEAIGIPANIAFVKRGELEIALPLTAPNYYFNHAIVYLPNQRLWLDPTNFNSMISPVFPDIANKPALILDIKNPRFEKIPGIKSESNISKIQEKWIRKTPENFEIQGQIDLTGVFSKNFTGLQKRVSEESIKHGLITWLNTNYGQILEKNVTLPDLSSTIVRDLSFKYDVQSRNFGLQTNAGTAIPLEFNVAQIFKTKKDTVSDIYLGEPCIVEVMNTIENIKPTEARDLNCYIQSPWADFARTVQYKDNGIIIHQMMRLKKTWLEGSDIESKTYKKFQLALDKHFNNGIALTIGHETIAN